MIDYEMEADVWLFNNIMDDHEVSTYGMIAFARKAFIDGLKLGENLKEDEYFPVFNELETLLGEE